MTGRPINLALRGFLLTGALFVAFAGAGSAQQSTPASKYDGVEAPKSMRVYAPLMSQADRDALTIKSIIFGAAGLGAVIALIVWRSLPPKSDKSAAGNSGQTISTTDLGSSGSAANPPAATPENPDAAAAEKEASQSVPPATTEAGAPVAESVEVTTPTEIKSES